jgi:hypothetical protein
MYGKALLLCFIVQSINKMKDMVCIYFRFVKYLVYSVHYKMTMCMYTIAMDLERISGGGFNKWLSHL